MLNIQFKTEFKTIKNKLLQIATICFFSSLLTIFSSCSQDQSGNKEPNKVDQFKTDTVAITTQPMGVIVAMGDSLTEGLGVDEERAYPALLQEKLQQAGYHYQVINAGISGETSSGAIARVDWILTLKPDIVILETGPNDGLRGIDLNLTKQNIDQTIKTLKDNDVQVILAGMQIIQNLGAEYVDAFADIYPNLAEKHKVTLIPFFLEGVGGVRKLNQNDGIHPTTEGYVIVTETVFPYVEKLIIGTNRN